MSKPDEACESVVAAGLETAIDWVVLTRGDRPEPLHLAIDSLRAVPSTGSIIVVVNGPVAGAAVAFDDPVSDVEVIENVENLGVPGGRNLGLRQSTTPLVGFLDDDARLLNADGVREVIEHFDADPTLAATSLRLVDEDGRTARRHIPRRGDSGVDRSGPVATFLGGASVVRRSAYEQAGGYWDELVYGHEELDLAWRLIGQGGWIRYAADVFVFHPRTEISRHSDGWWRTGRNRVLVARRNLPVPLLLAHTMIWLAIGLVRAPGWHCRQRYLTGWLGAWRFPVGRRPLPWSALRRLQRLGRFPIV